MSPAAADGPPYLARIRLTADGVPHGGGMLCAGRLVVTAAHVVSPTAEPPWRVFVDFPFVQGRVIAATVLPGGWHPSDDGDRGDIAVLELTEPPPDGVAQAPLLLASALAGHRFRAYGFPAGHPDGVWARGEIEGRAMGEWIQLVADAGKGYLIDRGFSGSPLFDETLGAVVGIVVAKEKDASVRGGFAIAIDVICRRIPLLGPLLGWRVSKDEDFLGYWDPRARGVDQAGRAGDYFTGRRCALETLVNWINTEAKAGLCALTGGLGSGKSALIARLLVLGDPDARDALGTRDADPAVTPPPGWADVGVRASMLRLGELRERLAAGLGLPSVDPDALVSGLAARTAATIVIDAVDEAADDPTTVIRELLVPIARHGGARVLAGIRPGEGGRYLRAFGSAATVIDLDDPAYFSQEDLVEYAARSLRLGGWHGGQSPYYSRPKVTARVAEAIALKARPSFLVAGLEARARADDPEVIDTTVPGWAELHTFPDNVRAAMESYVSRLPDPDRAFDLLVPLAFCRGTGPSEDLWAELASAYSGRSVALAELDRLLRSVVASLVETHSAGGVLTVSLGHQALSDTLRSRTSPKLVEALFAQVLARRAATDGWLAADDYTRGHLASHAAHGGWLDALLMQEPGYLVIADPDDLLAALPNAVARDAVQAAKAYRQCAPLLRQMPDVERISQLELSAYQVGNAGLARKLAALADGRMWRTLWAHATVKGDHLIIRTREAQSVALGVLADGTYAVISGGWGKTVRVWDIETGAAIGEPLEGHSEIVWGVAFCVLRDGTPVAVSCSADQTLRTWDLRSGTARGEPLRGHEGPIASVAAGRRGDGTPVAISGGQDGTVRVWDLESGAAIGAPLRGHEGIVWSVATGFQQDGTPVIVSAGDDHTVRVWDLETGAPIREPLRGHDGTVRSVAVAERNPERGTLILSGGHDRTIRMWDLDAGLQVARAGAPGMVAAVRFGVWKDGEDVIVVAGETGDVRILGATVTELRGHEGWVHTLTMGTKRDGTPVIVSGDGDGTVRVWGIPAAQLDAVASGHVGKVNDVAFAALRDGTPIVASGGADGTIRVWNAESGATVRPPLHSPHDEVFAVAAWTRGDGTPMLVSTGFHENDRVARIWDLESGGAAGEFGRGHIGTASAIAVTASAGRPVLVAGCHDGTVCVWDLESAALTVRTPGHDGPVFAVAVGAGPDGTLLVASGGFDRTVRVWELETGEPVGDQLPGHDGLASSVAIASMRDGSRVVATTDLPGTLRLWDLGSGTLVREARSGPDRHIVTMGFAETAAGVSHLVSADSSGAVEIREIYSWTVLPAPINLGSRPTGLKIRGPRCAFSAGQGVAVLELSL